MTDEAFWKAYREVELALSLQMEEFVKDKKAVETTKNAINELFYVVSNKLKEKYKGRELNEILYSLFMQNKIPAITIQEVFDIINFIKNINSQEPQMIYGMLVRILEVLEEIYFNA